MTDHRTPRLLIPDNTPLSLLAMVGEDALNWLFLPRIEVWVTDMVQIEALRDPDPGDDRRANHRKVLGQWFRDNQFRIHVRSTLEGSDYVRAMRTWVKAGQDPEDKPSWRNRGERSLRDILPVAAEILEDKDTVLVLVDDRSARALLRQAALDGRMDADIMATETFLALLETDYGVSNDEVHAAWVAIGIASGDKEPQAPDPDPIYVRARGLLR